MKFCFKNSNRLSVLSLFSFLIVSLCFPDLLRAGENYGFDLEKFEKKDFEWGGYVEVRWDHINLNKDSAFYLLNSRENQRATLDSFIGSLLIGGDYSKGIATFHGLLMASGQQDNYGWIDTAEIYEAYVSIKPSPVATYGIGKKSYKWGKGYAWNPVGFINRGKDPNNPEEALEGYFTAEMDLIKSLSGELRNAAFTVVALPVYERVNEDFGTRDNMNFAAKLYLLYRDTDIDLVVFTGNSRSTSFGFDFSKNLASNFEIHGEFAYTPDLLQRYLADDSTINTRTFSNGTYLLGLRYLTENDITSIVEFYHNDAGYSEEEMDGFFQLVTDATAEFPPVSDPDLLQKALSISQTYSRPQTGRNYLYARVSRKEPFDILYFSPGLTTIINLDDMSYSVTPEVVYTGFTNWEFRARFSYLNGGVFTEYGEKQNSNKFEVRTRFFF